jgi:HK97 family phage prohead protease
MDLKYLGVAFEAKAIRDDGTFEGYASVFGNIDAVRDVVAPGAFAGTLRSGRRVKMLWQHDPAAPIGRWVSLAEDRKGLFARGQILRDIPRANEVYTLMKNEAVDGLSIGFRTIDDETDPRNGVRTLKSVDLYEISVVTFPANEMATVGVVKDGFDAAELEAELRAAGLAPHDAERALAVLRRSLCGGRESETAAWARTLRRAAALLRS